MHRTNAKPAKVPMPSRQTSGANINDMLRAVQDPHTPRETKDHTLRKLDGLEGRPAHVHEGPNKDGGGAKLIKRRTSEKNRSRDDQGDPENDSHHRQHGEPKRVNFMEEPKRDDRDGAGLKVKALLHRDGRLLSKR